MIPSKPITKQIAMKDGTIHPAWDQYFSQITQILQSIISQEGFSVPAQSGDNVTILNNAKSNNKLLINSDTNELLVNLNGVFKTVQTA
jgi:hypothetical protein